jgi:signal peptidase I
MSDQAEPRTSFAHVAETIESVLIALILAFVFRAFMVEAFVIPTGSMAPTLYGTHIDHVCTNCGYPFAIDVRADLREVYCPNCDWLYEARVDHTCTHCGYRFPVCVSAIQREVPCPRCGSIDRVACDSRPVPPFDNGDRILVLKWPYSLAGFLAPKRWDLTVFKAPFSGPAAYGERDGQTNYIKRLAGLPGDILEIVDGDLYTCRSEEVSESIRAKLAHAPLPEPLTAAEKDELNEALHIARKPPEAQEALWQIVYDIDYQPTRKLTVGWQTTCSRPAWKIDGRILHFDGRQVEQPQFVELAGKNFRDAYGYNEGGGKRIVSDLRLKAAMTWQAGDGAILLCLSKYNDLFTVEISPGKGLGRAWRTGPLDRQAPRPIGPVWVFRPWRRNQPVEVSFANVDHQLQLRFDDAVVWQSGPNEFPTTAAWAQAQGYESSPPAVRIGAEGVTASLRHVAVHRDVYYRDDEFIQTQTASGRVVHNEYSDRRAWGSRDNPILLRQNEYFVMGDNSPQSFDSRRWWQTGEHLQDRRNRYRVGTVPADQMIGKAFFVYWPNGYRIFRSGLPVVPNVGEMRWVR